MTDDDKRYLAAAHAMQSGVAAEMEMEGSAHKSTQPKHLRVGINTAMSDHGALVKLLVDTGLIDLDEYKKAIADHMEGEKESYETKLSAAMGRKVTLG